MTAVLACAAAFAPVMSGYATYARWETLNVPFYVNPANSDVALNTAISALQTGMDVWNSQSGAPFRFSYAGQANDTDDRYDNRNVILFRNGSGGAIATTYSWWTSSSDSRRCDVVFWDGDHQFFAGSSGCTGGAFIEDVGAHELGHAMGLSHSSMSDATMYRTTRPVLRNAHLDQRRQGGRTDLYGVGGGSTSPAPETDTPQHRRNDRHRQ